VAKKNAKNTERRAMVEQMRAEQARKERMRSLGILGTCVVIVVGLLGVAVFKYIQDQNANKALEDKAIKDLGVSATVAACDPIKTTKTDKNQTHIPAPTPITYNDAPPAFGAHRPAPAAFGRPFYTSDRPEIAELVHNEEHGFTIAWYDDTAAKDKAEMKVLEQIATKYQDANQKFIAAPWHTSDGAAFPDGKHIALTRWSADADKPTDESKQRGNWQYCGQVSGTVISDFFNKWSEDEAPENIPVG
jgi:cytoskeletal protein RodZ